MLKNTPLSNPTFGALRDYIYDKSGIYVSDTKKYLVENRLSRILQENKLNTYEDYLKHIKVSSNGTELNRLFDAITTNETYFFREPLQLDVVVNNIVPKIMSEKKGKKSIKIWSAACSTGEEAYTLSLMLREKGLSANQFEIYGSDISDNVLKSANNAVYNSYSIRNIAPALLKTYFSCNGQSYALNDPIKKSVKFSKANLIEANTLRSFRGMDIIFCRNVLIYFDNKSKQKTVSHLYDNLNPGGHLIIGSSESLHFVTRAFRPNVMSKVVTYQKI